MSIGLTLKVAYNETCEVCDKIAQLTKVVFHKMIETFEILGRSRAAAELYRQGYIEEAKNLMLEVKELKSK